MKGKEKTREKIGPIEWFCMKKEVTFKVNRVIRTNDKRYERKGVTTRRIIRSVQGKKKMKRRTRRQRKTEKSAMSDFDKKNNRFT